MNILFCGLGSIGIKHARLIKDLYPSFNLYAYRTGNGKKIENLNITEYPNFSNLISEEDIDVAFITNPTFLHAETALRCAKNNIDLFIEKPLSHSLNYIQELEKEIKKNDLFSYVAYNLRFHPVLKELKKILSKNSNPFYFQACASSYLPKWRPNRDYRNTYSAKKKEGGGVLLDLSHEIDYINWFFGIESLEGSYGKISELEVDSDDFADLEIFCSEGLRGSLHLDYFSRKRERKIQIHLPDMYLEGDLENDKILTIKSDEKNERFFNVDKNYTYRKQLKYFFEKYRGHNRPMNNFFEAKKLLTKIINFKKDTKFKWREDTS